MPSLCSLSRHENCKAALKVRGSGQGFGIYYRVYHRFCNIGDYTT